MATPSKMASSIVKQATSIGMEAATLALRLADEECKQPEPGAPLSDEMYDLIQGLVDLHNPCMHEETHRGGVLWTICDACGARWADDQGGKPKYEEPKAITDAYAVLAKRNTVPTKPERSDCEFCHGGTPGNENIVDGITMCDYCTVIYGRGKGAAQVDVEPLKVTDRMQGVDCPLCEDMTPHTHGAHSPEYDHECGRTCAGDGCVCPCHTTESAPIASTAQADWDDQHRGKTPASGPCSAPGNWSLPDPVMLLSAKPQPAPVDGDLAERAHNVFISAPSEPWKAVIRLVQQDSNGRWEKATAAYLLDEHGWNVCDALFAASKIRARVEAGSLPPTLQERITERFKTQRCINSSVWNPAELAAIAMEEIAKEQNNG